MDKLIVDQNGKSTISNDGATIMKLLDIVHPAAKTLVDIAKSQDAEVGDGTTSVVLLAGEILKQVKPYVEEGVHPRIVIKAVRKATSMALQKIDELAVKIQKSDSGEYRGLLEKCAATALSSKLIHQQKGFFSKMVVDAVMSLDDLLPLNMIGIKKVAGGALEDSLLVDGVSFKKTFAYAGFEMQPKTYKNPKIALLNIELELKAERDNAEIRLDSVEEYQKVVDAEWKILYEKLDKIHASGAQVVLSKLPIGDVATQYFADRDMFCAGRVPEEDLKRTMKACGGAVMTTAHDLNDSVLGTCAVFDERQIGSESCAENILLSNCWYGVDITKEDISDNMESCVWEPAIVKKNAITAASEAACLVLSVDETIKNPKAGGEGGQGMPMPGRGRGRPM
ncbi:T-complex protein 1 subunit eta [Diaphorina citri]|uniref:CCT-eta n=1 Tax=Diaphorina citri TaxID=121845 RepID=A0A3Q0JE11_DIACI|nr:T-complex protein 1 subunit eta [Diaphorina citri]